MAAAQPKSFFQGFRFQDANHVHGSTCVKNLPLASTEDYFSLKLLFLQLCFSLTAF